MRLITTLIPVHPTPGTLATDFTTGSAVTRCPLMCACTHILAAGTFLVLCSNTYSRPSPWVHSWGNEDVTEALFASWGG